MPRSAKDTGGIGRGPPQQTIPPGGHALQCTQMQCSCSCLDVHTITQICCMVMAITGLLEVSCFYSLKCTQIYFFFRKSMPSFVELARYPFCLHASVSNFVDRLCKLRQVWVYQLHSFFCALQTQASMGVPTVRRAMLNATSLKNYQQWTKMLRLPKVQLIEGQEHTQNEGQSPAASADIHNLKTDFAVVIVSCRVFCAYV